MKFNWKIGKDKWLILLAVGLLLLVLTIALQAAGIAAVPGRRRSPARFRKTDRVVAVSL